MPYLSYAEKSKDTSEKKSYDTIWRTYGYTATNYKANL